MSESRNPLDYPLTQQVKALLTVVSVVLAALVVSLPDAVWLKVTNGVVIAVLGYFATFNAKNA